MPTSYADFFPGTAKTWASSGGDYAITLHNIANAVGREGVKGDLQNATYGNPAFIEWWLEWSATSSPTAGNLVELWVGESNHATAGTNNPGTLTGADAAVSSIADYKFQLSRVGALRLAASTAVQKASFLHVPKQRYLIPVVVNLSGITSTNTAGNFLIRATPFFRRIVT